MTSDFIFYIVVMAIAGLGAIIILDKYDK